MIGRSRVKDTATIFVSSTMSEETSDVVKRILNLALASFAVGVGWASRRTENMVSFPLVSESGDRCDAVYLDIKRPRPSRNVNEDPRRWVLREESNVHFIHGSKLLDGRAVNVAL